MRASLHAISREADNLGPLGNALFTLFAMFAPLLGQGVGKQYFTGRGGPFCTRPLERITRLPLKCVRGARSGEGLGSSILPGIGG